ncbi:MAG TPA: acetyl-CoA hydrolase/transferase C-terminal domain-containing protein [Dehalococcoidia bacterium]|nr:acetyl-CoA hydrolase/transferase C-terminal domain-containing protein [Dehalococcoidia bacterium]
MPDWRERYAAKLVSPDEAVRVVRDGDRVVIGMHYQTPLALCRALAARAGELHGVEIENSIATFISWWQDGEPNGFTVRSFFLQASDRPAMRAGLLDYVIAPPTRSDESYWLDRTPDVFLVSVSPPDADGWCSFGMSVWGAPEVAAAATHVVGEVNERFVRTGGNNRVHVSRFEALVEAPAEWKFLRRPPGTQEEDEVAAVIGSLVGHEIVRDGDTLQFGTGTVSAAMSAFVGHRHDLGVHSELVFGGIPSLVGAGVITGARKTVHPGKVVGASFGPLSPEEFAMVDGDPRYELYTMSHTNDIATIAAHDNMCAINNALTVDLTGQINGESIGPTIYSGTGGAFAFAVGALHAKGGRSVTVLPSASVVDGERRSRILPVFPEGTAVTVPRGYADIVVSEHGIARIKGQTLRKRIDELIGIAHPDFRAELRADARRLYGIG